MKIEKSKLHDFAFNFISQIKNNFWNSNILIIYCNNMILMKIITEVQDYKGQSEMLHD